MRAFRCPGAAGRDRKPLVDHRNLLRRARLGEGTSVLTASPDSSAKCARFAHVWERDPILFLVTACGEPSRQWQIPLTPILGTCSGCSADTNITEKGRKNTLETTDITADATTSLSEICGRSPYQNAIREVRAVPGTLANQAGIKFLLT